MLSTRNDIARAVPRWLAACCAVIVFLFPSAVRAQQYLGVGFHIGAHHDVGNMSSYNSGFEVEPQTSYILGVAFKGNYDFLFLRAGVDIAFPLIEGDVIENYDATDPVEKYSISYTGLPLLSESIFRYSTSANSTSAAVSLIFSPRAPLRTAAPRMTSPPRRSASDSSPACSCALRRPRGSTWNGNTSTRAPGHP